MKRFLFAYEETSTHVHWNHKMHVFCPPVQPRFKTMAIARSEKAPATETLIILVEVWVSTSMLKRAWFLVSFLRLYPRKSKGAHLEQEGSCLSLNLEHRNKRKLVQEPGTNWDDPLNKREGYLLWIKLQNQEKGKLNQMLLHDAIQNEKWNSIFTGTLSHKEIHLKVVFTTAGRKGREVWPNKDNSKGLSASKLDGDGSAGGYKVGNIRNLPLLFCFFRVKWSLHNDLIQTLTELVVLYF